MPLWEQRGAAVHAAEALLNLPIPRFLLQPIVENSFEHGFAGKAPDAERLIVVKRPENGEEADFAGA